MRLIRSTLSAALACLTLAACVPAPPKPTPAPTPAPAPTPVRAAPPPAPAAPSYSNWMDAPLTPGDWRYAGGLANFGETPSAPRLTMRCDGRGQVEIGYFGSATEPLSMTIRTEAMERTVADVSQASVAASGSPPVVGRVPARDPLLDAMAFSKGRFALEVSGQPALYVPAYPEVTRVIEDCR
jgi:hypothetical protein